MILMPLVCSGNHQPLLSVQLIFIYSQVRTSAVKKHVAKKKWEVLLEELSVLISSLHSAAHCLCNGEELLYVSGNITVVEDNWEVM